MLHRLWLLLPLTVAACSFPTDGVPLEGSPVDAEVEPDACIVGTETCEGTDQDCDGLIDEGFTSGAACDGPDTDACLDDTTICDQLGAEVCGDTSGDDDLDLCNGADDDCDGEEDEDFPITLDCDGDDGDECDGGTYSCSQDGLGVVCSDDAETILESCDGDDDDCDGVPDDGFDFQNDESNCGICNRTCTNPRGTTMCLIGNCAPVCSNGAASCDGNLDNGCEFLQDSNPTCIAAGTAPDVSVDGDVQDSAVITGTGERILKVHVSETVGGTSGALTAQINLVSGTGTDFDLYVHCPSCNASPVNESDETIEIGRTDAGGNTAYDVYAEIRYDPSVPSTSCNQWTVTVTGFVATANRCAD